MIVEIAVVVLVSLFLAAKFMGLVGAKKSQVFRIDNRRAPDPLVTNQEVRDKILKQGYAAKKVPATLDAIVIGRSSGEGNI